VLRYDIYNLLTRLRTSAHQLQQDVALLRAGPRSRSNSTTTCSTNGSSSSSSGFIINNPLSQQYLQQDQLHADTSGITTTSSTSTSSSAQLGSFLVRVEGSSTGVLFQANEEIHTSYGSGKVVHVVHVADGTTVCIALGFGALYVSVPTALQWKLQGGRGVGVNGLVQCYAPASSTSTSASGRLGYSSTEERDIRNLLKTINTSTNTTSTTGTTGIVGGAKKKSWEERLPQLLLPPSALPLPTCSTLESSASAELYNNAMLGEYNTSSSTSTSTSTSSSALVVQPEALTRPDIFNQENR
jgi:hypothetical protein